MIQSGTGACTNNSISSEGMARSRLRASNAAGRQMGVSCGSGRRLPLKPRPCRSSPFGLPSRRSACGFVPQSRIRPRALKDRSRRGRVRTVFRDGSRLRERLAAPSRRTAMSRPTARVRTGQNRPGSTRKSPTRSLPNWKQAVCPSAVENGGGERGAAMRRTPRPGRHSDQCRSCGRRNRARLPARVGSRSDRRSVLVAVSGRASAARPSSMPTASCRTTKRSALLKPARRQRSHS